MGLASILLVHGIFGTWIYFALIAGPGPMEMNDFHPFKSEPAKVQYYAYEAEMLKFWPVHSEERARDEKEPAHIKFKDWKPAAYLGVGE